MNLEPGCCLQTVKNRVDIPKWQGCCRCIYTLTACEVENGEVGSSAIMIFAAEIRATNHNNECGDPGICSRQAVGFDTPKIKS
jgi:hypothetical protein